MHTGADTLAKIGQISEWNYLDSINESVYPLPCGALSGSAGEFFPPGRDETYVDFFSPDLCRQESLFITCLKFIQGLSVKIIDLFRI